MENVHGQPVGEAVEWAPRELPALEPLEGRYVRLAPLSSAHYAELFAATGGAEDAGLWTYLPAERPTNLPALWMLLADRVETDPWTFSIAPAGEKPAGMVSLLNIDPAHGTLEIGWILLGAPLQRTRAATEAFHLLLRHAFDDLGYRRVEWKCDSLNEPSRQAALRLGFTFEGTFRRHRVVKGHNRDTDWFAITDAEWPEVRARHERWLAAENFDEQGKQRRPLERATDHGTGVPHAGTSGTLS